MRMNILKRCFLSMLAMILAILLFAGSADACQSTPTIRSVFSGDWNDSKIWNTGKVPDRSDVVSIEAGHTVTASYIRVKGLCNAGTLSILSDAVFGVVTDDFIYNNGKIISAVGATHLDDWVASPPGQTIGLMSPSVHNAANGVIEAGQGGYSWQWKYAYGGAGGDVLLYGYTILNEGTITGGQGGRGDAFRDRWCEAYGGIGGSVVVFARDKATNTGKLSGGAGGGAIHNGDGVSVPGGVGSVTFSAPSAAQSGVIQGNVKDSVIRDSDNDGNQDVSEVQNGTNPFGQDIVTITGNGYTMVVTPYLSGHEVPMKITQESDGSYKGDNGIVSIVMKQSDSSRSKRDNGISTDYAFTISKSLSGQTKDITLGITPNADGTYTMKDPALPGTSVKITADGTFIITDDAFPGMLTTHYPDGNSTITSSEFPDITYTVKPDGSHAVTDSTFPGMTYNISPDGNTQTVTDTESPSMTTAVASDGTLKVSDTEFPGMTYAVKPDGTKLVTDTEFPTVVSMVNADGTYTVTDSDNPGTVVLFNPTDKTYTVTDAESPGAKYIFNPDGSYTVNDPDGNCVNVNKRFSFKKFINKAAGAVSKIAGIVNKGASFVSKVAGHVIKAANFVKKATDAIQKYAPYVQKYATWIGNAAFSIGCALCPCHPFLSSIAFGISGFAYGVANVAGWASEKAKLIGGIADKVKEYAEKVQKVANTVAKVSNVVQKIANKIKSWFRKRISVAKRSDTPEPALIVCKQISLYTASGIITDRQGNPVVNAVVRINDVITTSDQNGHWQIIGLSEGTYTVTALKKGLFFLPKSSTIENEQNVTVDFQADDPNCCFTAGMFTVDDTGIVKIDWLYDGGKYQGEFGIFNIAGMESLTPGSAEFIAEAVKRVLSNSDQGYVVFSDLSEGSRFSGILGNEIKDWNAGPYKGLKSFTMTPGSQFATVLVPNSTFASLAQIPGTMDTNKRPLFSLISQNPAYGMYEGQMADVNGNGKTYVYEDKDADTSDWDFNDLIIQITGAASNVPTMDQLESQRVKKAARQKRDGSSDWRDSELGKLIMEHVESPAPTEDTISMTVTLNAPATLLVYEPTGKVIGKEGGYVAGADFELKADGTQTVTLPNPAGISYRVSVQGAATAQSTLTVKTYQGGAEISSDQISLDIAQHQILTTTISASDTQPPSIAPVNAAMSYDFNGDGVTDNEDVSMLVKHWNSCRGQQKYDAFFDVNDDGCITVADIMTVLNAKTVK